MSESAPRISDEAVEFWAKRKFWMSPNDPWADIGDERRARLLDKAREDLTAILPLLCGEPDDDRSWSIYACPEPDCEEFDTLSWTGKRASLHCAKEGHPEAERIEVAPVASLPLSGELVEEREDKKQRSEGQRWTLVGRTRGAPGPMQEDVTVLTEGGPVLPYKQSVVVMPVAEYQEVRDALLERVERGEKAEQELEQVRGEADRAELVAQGACEELERAEGKLSQVREEVESWEADSNSVVPGEAAQKLLAILDSSSSLSGDGGSSGVESKLQAGYSLCHPEDDCAGQRAWLKAAGERDRLAELIGEAADYLRGLAADSRMEAEGGGGELPAGDQRALTGKAEGYDDSAEYLATELEAALTQPNPEPHLSGDGERQREIDQEAQRIARVHALFERNSDRPDGTAYGMAREAVDRRHRDLATHLSPENSSGVEEGRIEALRLAVTRLQATMFLTGSPPKDQDEALAALAALVDSLGAEQKDCAACNGSGAIDGGGCRGEEGLRERVWAAALEFNARADRAERTKEQGGDGAGECIGEKVAFNEAADHLRRSVLAGLEKAPGYLYDAAVHPTTQEPQDEEGAQ